MRDQRDVTAAFTGHRSLPKDTARLKVSVENAVIDLIHRGVAVFMAGGASGFDALASLIVLGLKDTHFTQIKLIQVLPFNGMEEQWDLEQKKTFYTINNRADSVVYLADHFIGNEQYHARNRYLVDHSSHLIAFCKNTKARSGTASCYRYAVRRNINITLLEY